VFLRSVDGSRTTEPHRSGPRAPRQAPRHPGAQRQRGLSPPAPQPPSDAPLPAGFGPHCRPQPSPGLGTSNSSQSQPRPEHTKRSSCFEVFCGSPCTRASLPSLTASARHGATRHPQLLGSSRISRARAQRHPRHLPPCPADPRSKRRAVPLPPAPADHGEPAKQPPALGRRRARRGPRAAVGRSCPRRLCSFQPLENQLRGIASHRAERSRSVRLAGCCRGAAAAWQPPCPAV